MEPCKWIFKFRIRSEDGVVRIVEIKATSSDKALRKLYKKHRPLVVYNNHF